MSLLLTLIFLLGWPFEWPAIVFIFLPMLAPVAKGLGYDMVWFGCIVAVVLQTAFLSPPVAMSAYYLKQVVKEWNLRLIYRGMADFMVLQVLCVALVLDLPGHRHVVPATGCRRAGWRHGPRRSSRSRRRRTSPRHPTVHALRSGISEFFRRAARRYKDARPRRWQSPASGLHVPVGRFIRPRPAAVACDHEQRADERQVLQGVDQRLGIFGRRLVPEIVEVEGRRDARRRSAGSRRSARRN